MSQGTEVIDLSESIPADPDTPLHNSDDQQSPKDIEAEKTITQIDLPDQKRPLNFIDLPPEIRNMIYRLLVAYPHISTPKPALEDFAIFHVNRLIWSEASAIFHADNIFRFSLNSAGCPKPTKRIHPSLNRISKCHIWRTEPYCSDDLANFRLHVNGQDEYARVMIQWFAEALKGKNQLKCLLVDLPHIDATLLEPLAALRNIKQVEIKCCWPAANFGSRSVEIVQRLETIMKSDVKGATGVTGLEDVPVSIDLERVEMRKEVEEFERMKVLCEFEDCPKLRCQRKLR